MHDRRHDHLMTEDNRDRALQDYYDQEEAVVSKGAPKSVRRCTTLVYMRF
jgi:hypothetical protein